MNPMPKRKSAEHRAKLFVLMNLRSGAVDAMARFARLLAARDEADADPKLRWGYDPLVFEEGEVGLVVEGTAAGIADLVARLAERGYLGFFVAVESRDARSLMGEHVEHLSLTVDPGVAEADELV